MNNYQHDIFGGSSPTNSTNRIIDNIATLINEQPDLLHKENDDIVWAYLQKFHGVGDAISRQQFFDSKFPNLDSVRRKLCDYKQSLKHATK